MLTKIIDKIDFLAFGETEHGTHVFALDLILKEIDKFERIFLEIPINLQESINSFLKSKEINTNLSDFLKGARQEGKNLEGFLLSLLNGCSGATKQVFCIDSSKERTTCYNKRSKEGLYFLASSSREEDMFNNIKKVLVNSKGKSFLFGGSAHIKYGLNRVDDQKTLGSRLKDLLGARFYNVCLWKLSEFKSYQFYDTRNALVNKNLNELLEKHCFSNLDEKNNRYFDGYLIHC